MGKAVASKANYLADNEKILFGLLSPYQKAEIEAYCFDSKVCGKIRLGIINDDVVGSMCVCKEEHCRFELGRAEIGTVSVRGVDTPVWVRRLMLVDEAKKAGILPDVEATQDG